MKKLFFIFLFLCSLAHAKLDITLIHTNDHHGRYWKNRKGEYGMAARKTLLDQLRKEAKEKGREVLLLSGGDINTGVPESDLLNAEPDFKGMKLLGYDVMVFGNHEFDNSREILEKQIKWAGFPIIGANIYERKTGKRAFIPYVKKEINGVKIIIVGFTTEDTNLFSKVKSLRFRPILEEAREIIPKLRKEADILIGLTHIGYFLDNSLGIFPPGDVALAKATNGAFDIIVGGHSQVPLARPVVVKGTRILQAYEHGKFVGKLDLSFVEGKLKVGKYRFIPVNLKQYSGPESNKKIPEDPQILSFLRPYKNKVGKKLNIVLGKADNIFYGRPGSYNKKTKRREETNLGRAVAHAFCETTRSDICFIHNGGVRENIEKGPITYKRILEVMPFGNNLCRVPVGTKDIVQYIEKAFSVYPKPLHFYGVRIKLKNNKIEELATNKNKKQSLLYKNGKVIDKGPFYLSSICYLTDGKRLPKLSRFKGHQDTGVNDALSLKEFIEKRKGLKGDDYLVPSSNLSWP